MCVIVASASHAAADTRVCEGEGAGSNGPLVHVSQDIPKRRPQVAAPPPRHTTARGRPEWHARSTSRGIRPCRRRRLPARPHDARRWGRPSTPRGRGRRPPATTSRAARFGVLRVSATLRPILCLNINFCVFIRGRRARAGTRGGGRVPEAEDIRGPARAQRTPTLTAASISLSSPIPTCLRPCTTHPHSQPPNTPWLLFWAPNLRPLAHRDGRRGPRRANYVLHEHRQGGERLAPQSHDGLQTVSWSPHTVRAHVPVATSDERHGSCIRHPAAPPPCW